jgi:DNA polymerase-3 subunit epsilon
MLQALRAARRFLDRRVIRDRDYLFLFGPDETGEVVSLDCETTGLDPWVDDIISIAAIRIKGRRLLTSERFEALVRPSGKMAEKAIKVHRLRQVDVAAARPMSEILPDLLRFIGPRQVVGYYIDFDMAMLDKYVLELLGINLPNRRIEVSEQFYKLKYGKAAPGSSVDLSFAAILKDLDIPERPEHDAFNDALMAGMMHVKLVDYVERAKAVVAERPSARAQAMPVG